MYYYLLTRFLVKPQDPQDLYASWRNYESMSNCLALAAVAPGEMLLVNLLTTFADILTCAVLFILWGATAFSSQNSHSLPLSLSGVAIGQQENQ